MGKYLLLFLGGFAISLALTPIIRWLAIRVKAMDIPNERKVHDRPIPRLGGVAIFIAFTLIVFLAFSPFALIANTFLTVGTQWWKGYLPAACIIMVLGIFDDLKPLGARVKFLTQALAACCAMYFGYVIKHIDLPWGTSVHLGLWGVPVTLVWIVGLTNAFNLIDGLDGLASGVAFISSLTLMGIALLGQNIELALVCSALAGCLLGFLPYNFHPASIFLGDSGSLFLGFTLAVLSITTSQKSTVAVSILIPMMAFGLPIMDALLAMIRRFLRAMHVWETTGQGTYRLFFLRGKSMFEADRDHIHHRLMRLGIYHRNAVIFLYAICAAMSVAALVIASYRSINTGIVLAAIGVAVIVGIRKLRYEELQFLRNGSLVPLSRFPALGYESFQIPIDLVMVSLAYYATYWLRYDGVLDGPVKAAFITTLPAVLLTKIVVFQVAGLYRIRWRQAGVPEMLRGIRAMILGSVATAVALTYLTISKNSGTLLIIDFYIMSSFLLGSRFSARLIHYYAQSNPAHKKRVLIYGTGPSASLLICEILANQHHSLAPVGFIDEHQGKHRKILHGYPVLGPFTVLPEILQDGGIEELIIATPNLPSQQFDQIKELCLLHGVTVRQFRVSLEEIPHPSSLALPLLASS
jgi:UDP-GlcNAc:undecaprenyl-phosphate/decaprenyl-phosphate GlcNAc-1-phosphate transferase